jgi:hypothetical protein
MNLSKGFENIPRKFVLVLLLTGAQTLASGQEEKKTPSLPVKKPSVLNKLGGHAKPAVPAGKTATTVAGKPGATTAPKPGAAEKPGMKQVSLRDGGKAQVRPDGQIRSVDRGGMHIERNLHGGRTVVSERNGKRIVTTGGQGGYVQRPLVNRGGHSYYARTSYDRGVARSGVYRGYSFKGRTYYGYQPPAYYHPAFYGWASSPWPGPVAFGVAEWGWAGAPWYGYYGFTPYPLYAGPAFWLTDYLVAANLQAAYADVAAMPPPASGPTVPAALNVCEQGGCSTWTWDGAHYNAVWSNGAVSVISVVRWEADAIVLARIDPSGSSTGNTATYSGRMLSANAAGGGVTGTFNGGVWSETWNASSPGPLLPASAAPSPAAVPVSDPVVLTPEVKEAIAEEVKAQLAEDKAAAVPAPQALASSDEMPPALDPARRTFVVSADLAVSADGQECSLTQGDVIMRLTDTPDADQKVNVSVASSKRSDCAAGKLVAVSVDDLQEMRNRFDEQLGAGLKSLASKQGTGKIPKAPDTGTVASTVPVPPPDATAAKDLQEQQSAADQTEADVKRESASGGAGGQ